MIKNGDKVKLKPKNNHRGDWYRVYVKDPDWIFTIVKWDDNGRPDGFDAKCPHIDNGHLLRLTKSYYEFIPTILPVCEISDELFEI